MSLGTLTLHRFNGDEVFNVSEAEIRYFVEENHVIVDFQVNTDDKPLKTLPDTESLNGWPNGAWQLSVPSFDPDNLVGKTFSIPQGYDEETEDYLTNFYYVEHETIDDNEIVVLGREGEKFQCQIKGKVTDVNYYDGSKPRTEVVILANFSLSKADEPIDPVG